MINVYIGWDSREAVAADVCEYTIRKNATEPVNTVMLKQEELRAGLLYSKELDDRASSEFTFTRYLVPKLNNYQGWAVFTDSDTVWLGDVRELIEQADDRYAVMVVKHDYRPQFEIKMDGRRQEYYPRKNWSSVVLWNCAHPKNAWLTPYHIKNSRGLELHQFCWLDDSDIGELNPEWNWLVNWYHQPWDGTPKVLHYTEGGPWFERYQNCEYAEVWQQYARELRGLDSRRNLPTVTDLGLCSKYKDFFCDVLEYVTNPQGIYGPAPTKQDLIDWIEDAHSNQIIGISEEEDVSKKMKEKGNRWDGIVHAFVEGAAGRMGPWTDAEKTNNPIALRSIAKKRIMQQCLETGRDFYYIDTGYFGNKKLKDYHRITKNAMQWLGPVEDRPSDRFDRTRTQIHRMTPGSKILICPPSGKAMSYWGLDENEWVAKTVEEIRQYTDREIKVRFKQSREIRSTVDTMEMALRDDVHCIVTFNSIAAVESLIYGKPVFTLGPNAAQPLANTDLSLIDDPFVPTTDEVYRLLCCLAYHQFTVEEMRSGYAWAVLSGAA